MWCTSMTTLIWTQQTGDIKKVGYVQLENVFLYCAIVQSEVENMFYKAT